MRTLIKAGAAGAVLLGAGLVYRSQTKDPSLFSQRPPVPSAKRLTFEEKREEASQPSRSEDKKVKALKKFRSRFGADLEAQFSKNGKLILIIGKKGSNQRSDPGFAPGNPEAAIARAREILEGAKDLLELRPEFPLDEAVSRPSDDSVKVFFQETFQGIPVAPFGNVSVDLGPQGELLKLESDYLSDLTIENERKISPDSARASALASVAGISGTQGVPVVEGGGALVWVPRGAGAAQPLTGRYAYQYYVDGHQVVVDASDGKVIFQRNRRQN